MIESIVYLLLAIGNIFFEGYVFMFGWNSIVHKIGFPTIPYIVGIGLCAFISYVRHNEADIEDNKEVRLAYVRHSIVENVVHNCVYLVIFLVISWFM